MNERALRILEYDKIIQRLTEEASTPLGKKKCMNLLPMSDIESVTFAQKQTSDALTRLFKSGSISFSGANDIRESFKRLEIGSSLNTSELLAAASLLRVANRAKSYGRTDRTSEDEPDSLDSFFDGIEPLTPLEHEIDRCIISEEEIADDATPGLKNVRRQMASAEERIRAQMNSCLSSNRTYLQDSVIAMRGGRYCLPVKAEYRSQVDGLIHDQSGSGSTLFIEPASVVRLNNELRELEIKEQKEIEILLAQLSAQCAEHLEAIQKDLEILSELDFIFARANLAKKMNASVPVFNTEGRINIKKGRHPLIDPKKAVPIDIRLGETYDLLIVTGPNTGGKTVSLKTVGLFQLMGQAGLHIPAFDGSSLSVFKEIYPDIGDEQSIEQSLSTFSSHMTNIVSFLEKADSDSLVLFDELGAGTDPTEGAALAIAILSFLHNMKIRTMATTHYSELKIFALNTPGVENASCEFDVETLRPTYRLLIGIPGKSNAFAISSKLGIPDYIIEEAQKHLNDRDISFEDLLTDLENSRRRQEEETLEIQRLKQEAEALKRQNEQRQKELDEKRDKLIEKAREDARKILQDAKDFADESIREVNKIAAGSEVSKELEKRRTALGKKLKYHDAKAKTVETVPASMAKTIDPKQIRIGDTVYVKSMKINGTVHTLPNSNGDLFVQMGIIRSQVNLRDLELLGDDMATAASKAGVKKSSGHSSIGMEKSYSISPEINLIGMTVDEAMAVLDKYLDDAYLSHLTSVRIVHGRGTGALRAATQKKLKQTSYIKSFHLGEYGEGDSGVTIAEFKGGK